jgi:hypothetical protein
MNCDECIYNHTCLKPYDSPIEIQIKNMGRSYTKEEWENEGECCYFENEEK